MAAESEVWQNMDLVEMVCKRINLDSSLAASVGLDVLRDAAKTHKPERGTFRTYAFVCLKRALLRYKREQGLNYDLIDIEDSRQSEPESLTSLDPSIRELVTEEEYELLYAWFVESVSRAALEARYGVLRTTLWVRVQKIIKRVRAT